MLGLVPLQMVLSSDSAYVAQEYRSSSSPTCGAGPAAAPQGGPNPGGHHQHPQCQAERGCTHSHGQQVLRAGGAPEAGRRASRVRSAGELQPPLEIQPLGSQGQPCHFQPFPASCAMPPSLLSSAMIWFICMLVRWYMYSVGAVSMPSLRLVGQ